MTAVALESHAPTEGQRCYLDASALIALAYEDAVSAGVAVRADERSRARRVREYVLRVRRLGARLVTSILAMEELAAMTRNKARDIASRPLGRSWVELKRDAPDDARRVDELCRQQMLDMMEHAAKATGDLGVSFELPVVLEGDASAAATRLRKVHREYLRRYVTLDAMDALHIAVGRMIGADCFVSFDAGWREVSDITVCY